MLQRHVMESNVRPEYKGAALEAKEASTWALHDIYKWWPMCARHGGLWSRRSEQVFDASNPQDLNDGIGTIAGCAVTEGKSPWQLVRLLRDQCGGHEGKRQSQRSRRCRRYRRV